MILKNVLVLCMMISLLIPVTHVSALSGDAELVLEDVGISPSYPKQGDLVSITADIYNAGFVNTDSVASIVTIAYFVDGNLLHVDEIGDVTPGISNKIRIHSPPVWKYDVGDHEIRVVVDYHNTLGDEYDSPLNNSADKILSITNPRNTHILLEAFPQYFLPWEKTSKITVSLFDSDIGEFLNDRKIILNFDGNNSTLITDKQGKVSFSNTVSSSNPIYIEAYFDGDDVYASSHSSLVLYSLPKETSSSLILQISDLNAYDFENNSFEILIYQDSYEKLIKKIQPDSMMLFDSKTFWISLPPGHGYFAEVYLDGQFFSVIDKELLQENSIIVKKIQILEMGKIKFVVKDAKNQLVHGAIISNWIYESSTDGGFTEWMDVLPAIRDPYVVTAIFPDQSIVKSEPFLVFPGEQKIIEIAVGDILPNYEIPSWIKNNAGWWSDGLIDDDSFVRGIQFLVQEEIILVPLMNYDYDESFDEIPSWIKNNAGWWSDGLIDDDSFVHGIQFMIKEGLMTIS